MCILQPWAHGLDKAGLLGIINMPHFGRLNAANMCVKQLLVCFHGGTLCLDIAIVITVDLISEITGFPKDGVDPSQYFRGIDNDKWFATQLKERYDLQRDSRAYHIDGINERVVCIGTYILSSKFFRKNIPI